MQQIEKKEDLLFFVLIWKFFRLICHIQSHFRPIFTLKNCLQNRPAKMILKMLRVWSLIIQPDDSAKNESSRSWEAICFPTIVDFW